MFRTSVIAPALLAFSLFATVPVFAAGADATIHEVYQDAEAGRFDDAQAKMNKVLQDHPTSAKAHYVEADLLAKQGKLRDAQVELNTAQRLDPSLSFAKPGRVQELQDVIAGAHTVTQRAPAYVQRQPVQPASSTSGMVWPIIIIAIIALIFMARMMMRRTTVITGGPGSPGYNGYGPSYGGGPGMMGGQGGGMGSGILGGLATGAAVGAGIVAGEELMHHFTDGDREREREVYRDNPRQDDSYTRQDDMGGNDFGVSDNSSWDSGGGGSDDW